MEGGRVERSGGGVGWRGPGWRGRVEGAGWRGRVEG